MNIQTLVDRLQEHERRRYARNGWTWPKRQHLRHARSDLAAILARFPAATGRQIIPMFRVLIEHYKPMDQNA